jgi:hypothetical protein
MAFAVAVLCLLAPFPANAQGDATVGLLGGQEDDPTDLTRIYRRGLTEWRLRMGWGLQHNLPTGPRTGMVGDAFSVSYNRFRSPRTSWGLEAGGARIRAREKHVTAHSAQALYTHVFSLEPRRIAYWDVGFGLMHFDRLVREQATHTNFVEHVGCGLTWPSGDSNAFSAEYRFLHVSNAGREHPNIGLNSSVFSVGYSWFR